MNYTRTYLFIVSVVVIFLHVPILDANKEIKIIPLKMSKKQKKEFEHLAQVTRHANHDAVERYLTVHKKDIKNYINAHGSDGKPILVTALMYDNNERTIKLLINAGADVNIAETTNGNTPLHLAIEQFKISIMELLLVKNADINRQNNSKKTPLDIAIMLNNVALLKLLILAADKSTTTTTINNAITVAQKQGYHNLKTMLQHYLNYRNGALSRQQLKNYLSETAFL